MNTHPHLEDTINFTNIHWAFPLLGAGHYLILSDKYSVFTLCWVFENISQYKKCSTCALPSCDWMCKSQSYSVYIALFLDPNNFNLR